MTPATSTTRSASKNSRPRSSYRLAASAGILCSASSCRSSGGPIARSRSPGVNAVRPARASADRISSARRVISPGSGGSSAGLARALGLASGSSRSPASSARTPSASARALSSSVALRARPPSGWAGQPQGSYSPRMFDEYATTICFPRGGGGTAAVALSAGAAVAGCRGRGRRRARPVARRDRQAERDAGRARRAARRRAKSMSNLWGGAGEHGEILSARDRRRAAFTARR